MKSYGQKISTCTLVNVTITTETEFLSWHRHSEYASEIYALCTLPPLLGCYAFAMAFHIGPRLVDRALCALEWLVDCWLAYSTVATHIAAHADIDENCYAKKRPHRITENQRSNNMEAQSVAFTAEIAIAISSQTHNILMIQTGVQQKKKQTHTKYKTEAIAHYR